MQFDFDNAYDDWQKLSGVLVVDDAMPGLCRKLAGTNAHAFLLLVENNALRALVRDVENPIEKNKTQSALLCRAYFLVSRSYKKLVSN
jgi:hypothetical protein